MSNKPSIYAHCPAGCEWETVHKEDLGDGTFKPLSSQGVNNLNDNTTIKKWVGTRAQYNAEFGDTPPLNTEVTITDEGEMIGNQSLSDVFVFEEDTQTNVVKFADKIKVLQSEGCNLSVVTNSVRTEQILPVYYVGDCDIELNLRIAGSYVNSGTTYEWTNDKAVTFHIFGSTATVIFIDLVVSNHYNHTFYNIRLYLDLNDPSVIKINLMNDNDASQIKTLTVKDCRLIKYEEV